jgi:hypothetical protein
MKKLIPIVLIFALVAGCSFDQIVTDQWGLLAIKNAARGLGYAVAQGGPEVNDAVVAAYKLFKTGQLDPVAMTALIQKFKPVNPLIVFATLDLLETMGAVIQSGIIVDLTKIPPELWPIVETAYLQGYELGKFDAKAGIKRAVP